METLTVSTEVQTILGQLEGETKLCDTDGNTIGVFTPAEVAEVEHYEQMKRLFDSEEIKRRKATEKGVHTTQQILQRLQS